MTKMKVYQHKLIDNIRKQLSDWLSSNNEIHYSEVLRFFHSISGTAPTIKLEEIGRLASESMKIVERRGDTGWNRKNIQEIISPLLKECYQFEYENEIDFPIMSDLNKKERLYFSWKMIPAFSFLLKIILKKGAFMFLDLLMRIRLYLHYMT
ncbi:hypothetical protein [Bacillus sp. P14.5]|uniref:hypothetical protein n=1 Tax=Bacillus sp. P14.5 TaxID=1983400 RepID=UPI0013B04BD9|nr:hypothetical protein [Bacillus sp. P14.5]